MTGKVVLSLDSDFLQTESGNVRANKNVRDEPAAAIAADAMSRLYVVELRARRPETTPTIRLRIAVPT